VTVLYHPDVPRNIRRFAAEYRRISEGLAARFRTEVDAALEAVKLAPQAAGHFLHTGTRVVTAFRRRNLRAFPLFVLHAIADDRLFFGALMPSRSDPLTWLTRFLPGNR